jgi:hypothetical protein
MNPVRIAYNDQYQAAESEVRRRMAETAERTGSTVRQTDVSWIRDRFHQFARTMVAGKGRFCPHIGHSPMVAHTAAWAADQLVCTDCIGTLQPPDDADGCCDRCGQPGAPLHTGTAAHGPVLMTYRLCAPCTRSTT